jgi:hypothetical protein
MVYDLENPTGPPSQKLPVGERRKSLKFSLEDVFGEAEEGTTQEVKEFYDLTYWSEYVRLLGSEFGHRTNRPNNTVMYRGRKH